ncbi:MAG: DUF1203 domain-containing protein [Rhodobacter sp.]|nr:DUF1203 domain-containing protein [Rhodobacter sp.]
MTLTFHPYDQTFVDDVRAGGPDAYGRPAEHAVSAGPGNPCRSCLRDIPEGVQMLILAARPFPEMQPYAETGPVFLCADACRPWADGGVPPILTTSPDYLLKGYSADHRIVYGTGQVVDRDRVAKYAAEVLSRGDVAYVDVRSARNNCFQTRITLAP